MVEIRRNISGSVPPHHFYIPMPVNQWRTQTQENTITVEDHLPLDLLSTSRPRVSHSPTRSAPSQRIWSFVGWENYTPTPYSSPSPQRRTRTETRTCTPVCCCPKSFELNDQDSGTSRDVIRMCRELGQSQSGCLI